MNKVKNWIIDVFIAFFIRYLSTARPSCSVWVKTTMRRVTCRRRKRAPTEERGPPGWERGDSAQVANESFLCLLIWFFITDAVFNSTLAKIHLTVTLFLCSSGSQVLGVAESFLSGKSNYKFLPKKANRIRLLVTGLRAPRWRLGSEDAWGTGREWRWHWDPWQIRDGWPQDGQAGIHPDPQNIQVCLLPRTEGQEHQEGAPEKIWQPHEHRRRVHHRFAHQQTHPQVYLFLQKLDDLFGGQINEPSSGKALFFSVPSSRPWSLQSSQYSNRENRKQTVVTSVNLGSGSHC